MYGTEARREESFLPHVLWHWFVNASLTVDKKGLDFARKSGLAAYVHVAKSIVDAEGGGRDRIPSRCVPEFVKKKNICSRSCRRNDKVGTIYISVCVCVCVPFIYIHVHTSTCIYTCIYIYIHGTTVTLERRGYGSHSRHVPKTIGKKKGTTAALVRRG